VGKSHVLIAVLKIALVELTHLSRTDHNCYYI